LDNQAIARVLREIADLLEIKDDNPFKIRAYRNGADIVANHPHDLTVLDTAGLREIPGIGKDLAARIVELSTTGQSEFHQELVAEFPPSVLDLLHLQGIGPKTVATFYRELGIRTIEDLEAACARGRLRALKGMGAKKEALILKALADRKQYAGRHLLADTYAVASTLVEMLTNHAPAAQITPVGSLRRGCETCGDIDILVSGADAAIADAFVAAPGVERVLARGGTKASILLSGGFQADLRLVPAESHGAAMQYFTGSKAHNIALRDRAIGMGFKLNEYGVFRTSDDSRVAGATEDEVYAALGLAWVPPELRENRGEIELAESGPMPTLVNRHDLRGDLHSHTTATDGKDSIEAMAEAARAAGLEYLAITDHSQALAMANGLDERRALDHAVRIRSLDGHGGVRLLAGIECDIHADGSLDLHDDCLAALDIVIVSVHSAFAMERQQMTDRLIRAIENPHVDILGHPSGRRLLQREPYPFDVEAVVNAAARCGVALEINCQVTRLDLNDVHARLARDRGVPLVISTDAHSRSAFERLRWGAFVARRAWLEPSHVLNTRSFDSFTASLRRNRRRS
jgi:DNA polymerase (family X)